MFRYTDKDTTRKACLARFNANGTPDVAFGIKGIIFNKGLITNINARMALAIQPNGKIVEYVSTNYSDNVLLRYNANSSIDKVFGTNGRVTVPAAIDGPSLSVAPDVKNRRILVNTPDFAIMGYTNYGKLIHPLV